jgi:hypothetical protein
MHDRLPHDLLLAIAIELDQASLERALACTRETATLRCDASFFEAVARARYGSAFWNEATTRVTWRAFRGWCEELRALHVFECELQKLHMPRWTLIEFRAFWDCEAAWVAKQKTFSPRPLHTSERS